MVDADPGDGLCAATDGSCTLRAAIQEANANAGTDTIEIPAGTYTLTIAGIKEDQSAFGDLDITDALIIVGSGENETIINANRLDRVFHNFAASDISNLTILGGQARDELYGSGIRNEAPLKLKSVTVRENGNIKYPAYPEVEMHAFSQGIFTSADLLIEDSQIEANGVGKGGNGVTGGGLALSDASTTTLIDTVVSNNEASEGGGIAVMEARDFGTPTLILNRSRVTQNKAYTGYGLFARRGVVLIDSSVIDYNENAGFQTTTNGAGIYTIFSRLEIKNSIVDNNRNGETVGSEGAAGISLVVSSAIIDQSIIRHNGTGRARGGGIYAGLSTPNEQPC